MRGFTLLELIVVIIIIGVLGALGFMQYTKVVEKGRSAEAKRALGAMRKAQEAYRLNSDGGVRTDIMNDLFVEAPTSCTSTHYFTYSTTSIVGTAVRCTGGSNVGKAPQSAAAYGVNLNYVSGIWGGSAGYF